MVCKKSIVAKILVFILVVFAFFYCSLPVRAENEIISENIGYFPYNETEIPYVYTNYILRENYKHSNGSLVSWQSDIPVYSFFANNGTSTYHFIYSFEPFDCLWVLESDGSKFKNINEDVVNYNGIDIYYSHMSCSYETSFPIYEVSSVSSVHTAFLDYMTSDSFIGYQPQLEANLYYAKNDSTFSLRNVKGRVENECFVAEWDSPLYLPEYLVNTMVFVDFYITDLDSGESSIICFPDTPDVYSNNRSTPFTVEDLTLSIPLERLNGLPENYRIDFVALSPYYTTYDLEVVPRLYKGAVSSIYLGYEGQFDFTINTPPEYIVEDITKEENVDKSILGQLSSFFGNFFGNFANMLKDLFIPTKEQIQSLFADMESFFSDKLGFLWFPFDLAITIVETFTYGEADSMLTVPPITINILGGIELYPGGQFDMDEVGIFPYVRIVTSILLACAVAGLAYNKWDEWIGGHDN